MHPQEMAIIKSLVSVAWADGEFADKEREMLDALLEAFHASPEQAAEVRSYASEKRTLDDLALDELSDDDCAILLQHAVLLSFVDGEQHETERALLDELAKRLPLPTETAHGLIAVAESRAKRFLNLL